MLGIAREACSTVMPLRHHMLGLTYSTCSRARRAEHGEGGAPFWLWLAPRRTGGCPQARGPALLCQAVNGKLRRCLTQIADDLEEDDLGEDAEDSGDERDADGGFGGGFVRKEAGEAEPEEEPQKSKKQVCMEAGPGR